MAQEKPSIVVTGCSGNLGSRLLEQLRDFRVIGIDLRPPAGGTAGLAEFIAADFGLESSCTELVRILREHRVSAVVHLAFVIDPLRTGVTEVPLMWQINVAGTARVMEAIAEVNRTGGNVRKFIFPSSVSAYGPDLPPMVTEDQPLQAHTLAYAVHKKEADEVVRFRAPQLGPCTTYLLRPHIFVGPSVENYLVGSLRGLPTGRGKLAARLRAKGRRLPLLLPSGDQYPLKRFQFVHIDDVARLIAELLRRKDSPPSIHIFNVAGRGAPVTIARAAEIANMRIQRLPTRALCVIALRLLWKLGISGVPPDAFPYIAGTYTMGLDRLQRFLGTEYEKVIRYTVEDALRDTFSGTSAASSPSPPAASISKSPSAEGPSEDNPSAARNILLSSAKIQDSAKREDREGA